MDRTFLEGLTPKQILQWAQENLNLYLSVYAGKDELIYALMKMSV